MIEVLHSGGVTKVYEDSKLVDDVVAVEFIDAATAEPMLRVVRYVRDKENNVVVNKNEIVVKSKIYHNFRMDIDATQCQNH